MITLEPMNDGDFNEYIEWSVKNYADEKVKAGSWPEEGSFEHARNEFNRLLPDGKETDGNYLLRIMDGSGKKVGILWLGIIPQNREMAGAFIWDIMVYPEYRGKGYGKEAMKALEERARSLGAGRISLHVFGHNSVAVDLYRKSGYTVTDLIMSKEI